MGREEEPLLCETALQKEWKGTKEEMTQAAVCPGCQDTASGDPPGLESRLLWQSSHGTVANVAAAAMPTKEDGKGADCGLYPFIFPSLVPGEMLLLV